MGVPFDGFIGSFDDGSVSALSASRASKGQARSPHASPLATAAITAQEERIRRQLIGSLKWAVHFLCDDVIKQNTS